VSAEAIERFDCFGGACGVYVEGDSEAEHAAGAAARSRETLLDWHRRFTRFSASSELSRLNADPRERVPVSPLMARLAAATRRAARISGGLVDATLLQEVLDAGYHDALPPALPLRLALALAPPRRPAGQARRAAGERLRVNEDRLEVSRPPGVLLDSGGLAKGLFADELGATLGGHRSFAVDCCGDLVLGGREGIERSVEVESPFDGTILHSFARAAGGVATSGIGRRSWLGSDGRPAHHLIDPGTGRPAFTGIVQSTALAPSALLAEIHAKAALLSGPAAAPAWLRWGGVLVFDDGSHRVIEPPATAIGEGVPAAERALHAGAEAVLER
jgi:thiamine biosynthesis lipoprotein